MSAESLPPNQYWGKKWIIYAALDIPQVNIDKWRLVVDGNVRNKLELSYEQLCSMEQVTYKRPFHCVTRWSIENVTWQGVKIERIASLAGVNEGTNWVMFHCIDGYTAPVPYEDAVHEDSIIALMMNGSKLSIEQGFPARPFIPHLYGWKSAKWLCRIEFMKEYADGYWEHYGYHERGNVWQEERFKGMHGRHMKRKSFGTA